ncbi:hypothetical protein [Leptospira inadai]|uniref:Uncharacterized protein n=1 Tax=Leptospira inadai serovar Lyme TaxID=293084 RepID=A0ABX4YCJ9_9LEPT|nr:hypothetical protein [Leptospira inadai]PNV71500.1 hypothetical protein BES34_021420 [Leptospira inadai serovar Lyme]
MEEKSTVNVRIFLQSMETLLINVLSPRRRRTEDRRVRVAHARQKLLDVGNAVEMEEKSTVNVRIFLQNMETLLINVLSPRRRRTEDRRVRVAHARQKLLDVGNAVEIEERSPVTQESFLKNMESPFVDVLSSVF